MKLALQILTVTLFISSYSYSSDLRKESPTDTTTNIIDKSTALIMLEEGKRLYIEGKIKDALIHFRQVAKKDPNSWRSPYWISNCHYSLSNYGFALKYANDAVEKNSESVDPEIYELLGKTYHHLGQVDSALSNFQKAQLLMPTYRSKDLNVLGKIEQCKFAKHVFESGDVLKRKRLGVEVNSGYDEYGAVLSKDGKMMYFTSRRNDTKGSKANPGMPAPVPGTIDSTDDSLIFGAAVAAASRFAFCLFITSNRLVILRNFASCLLIISSFSATFSIASSSAFIYSDLLKVKNIAKSRSRMIIEFI